MWLPWQTAVQIAVVLAVVVLCTTTVSIGWIRVARATLREATTVLVLYGIWQYVHEQAITKTAGAIEHARSLYRFEQALHLPSELTLQNLLIDHKPVMQFLNVYYGGCHVPAIGILLIWLYVRHRDRYAQVRTTLALSIAGCLAIQMIPVAPPRFLPELGFIDAGLKYHLSVYGTGGSGVSNQLAAMPSLHVGWAVLVGVAVVCISTSRWRWLVLLHPFLTVIAVVATANHWWLDGIVAAMVLAVAACVERVGHHLLRRARDAWSSRLTSPGATIDDQDRGEPVSAGTPGSSASTTPGA
jgi:hypothetical protein